MSFDNMQNDTGVLFMHHLVRPGPQNKAIQQINPET